MRKRGSYVSGIEQQIAVSVVKLKRLACASSSTAIPSVGISQYRKRRRGGSDRALARQGLNKKLFSAVVSAARVI